MTLEDKESTHLPFEKRMWSEIQSTHGFINFKLSSLSSLNDDNGYGFKRIANIIEKHWEEL